MAHRALTIRLIERDALTTEAFIEAVQDAVLMLRSIEGNMAKEKRPASRWRIEAVSLHSPLEITISEITPKGFEPLHAIFPFVRGLDSLNGSAQTPEHFGQDTLRLCKRLVGLLNNGLAAMEFLIPDEETARPTQHIAANVDQILGRAPEFYFEDTELEGRLEALSVHGQPEFWIYDLITDSGTRCEFEAKDLGAVADLVKRRARVRVCGKVKFNQTHHPVSVDVVAFTPLRGQDELPQIRDLHRAHIDITGGENAVEYIRGLRDAEEA
jgi:hypothetical protein